MLTLGFRNQWQYPDAWTDKTLSRLGLRYSAQHTGGAVGASRRLSEALANGRPAMSRPDRLAWATGIYPRLYLATAATMSWSTPRATTASTSTTATCRG